MNFLSANNSDLLSSFAINNMSTKLNHIELQYANSNANTSISSNNSNNKSELKSINANFKSNPENVWILRDEYKHNTKLSTSKVPNSCLKNSNQKSNKFVHYAPLLSQGNLNLKKV